mmetsp:Transcript_27264/g.58729  ORF Transcript_27264/g.58729 Transcript_27264/m.58729 type:complete len:275 (-) Transcript_27264:99-923(-)
MVSQSQHCTTCKKPKQNCTLTSPGPTMIAPISLSQQRLVALSDLRGRITHRLVFARDKSMRCMPHLRHLVNLRMLPAMAGATRWEGGSKYVAIAGSLSTAVKCSAVMVVRGIASLAPTSSPALQTGGRSSSCRSPSSRAWRAAPTSSLRICPAIARCSVLAASACTACTPCWRTSSHKRSWSEFSSAPCPNSGTDAAGVTRTSDITVLVSSPLSDFAILSCSFGAAGTGTFAPPWATLFMAGAEVAEATCSADECIGCSSLSSSNSTGGPWNAE